MEVSNQIHSHAEFWKIYDRVYIFSVLGIEEEYEDKFFFLEKDDVKKSKLELKKFG
jgi:hypothetical protein